ncbi:MAG: DUF3179 domain-containing protein [Candidatus Rokubacteria bacterium]|nr:DUF3179 domain-containing protein [Candidatus Rokubacteria bacterium]
MRREGSRNEEGLSRRAFLLALGVGAAAGASAWSGLPAGAAPKTKAWSLEDFAKNIQSGGPPKDGIPPIDRPKYVSAAEADKFLREGDIVFGLDYGGAVKAYPQKILVWHEVVNAEVPREKVSITYCPLTGSVVAFRGRSPVDGAMLTFGTTGKLVNSNLLMYDRQTDSHWPQILGAAIAGPAKAARLEEIPLAWTTWARWRRRYPPTLVLSTDTGYLRAYGTDPYGSYERSGTYYDSGPPFFPVMGTDNRFPAKKVMVGVKANGAQLAIPKAEFRTRRVANATLEGLPLVALYDEGLHVVGVYERRAAATVLTFRSEGGRIVDELTGAVWIPSGRCTEGKLAGTQLRQVTAYDVMWFAWYAFFPDTRVLETGKT